MTKSDSLKIKLSQAKRLLQLGLQPFRHGWVQGFRDAMELLICFFLHLLALILCEAGILFLAAGNLFPATPGPHKPYN
jgi:hypothetical protein